MKVRELLEKLQAVANKEREVYFDTDAAAFTCHLVPITDCCVEEEGVLPDDEVILTSNVPGHRLFEWTSGSPLRAEWQTDRVKRAKQEIEEEDIKAMNIPADQLAVMKENARKAALPPEEPDHMCGLMCDGQDGERSYCKRLRRKLGYS